MIPCFMLWGIFTWCTLCFEIPYCMFLGYYCCRCACIFLWHLFCALLVGCAPCMFCVILIGVLIESSSCGISLRTTPVWGPSYLYDRDNKLLCTSLLLTAPNAASYTTLIAARRRSPSWTNSVNNDLCFHVLIIIMFLFFFRMQMYPFMLF